MKLARLRIRNFRCYREEIAFDFDDLTALIGRNDSGKSSVMEALDVFFNDAPLDKNDATKDGDSKDLTLICEFTDLPSHAIIDEDVPTSFAAEHLLNANGRLEIHRTYSGQLEKPKCTGVSAYCVHPSAEMAADLIQLKNADLKKRAAAVKADLTNVDQKVNAQLRQAIRQAVGDLHPTPRLVPLDNDNAKKAWDGIKVYLPLFALFKSDRASTDQDPEAQDPLKVAVREAIKAKEAELKAISTQVEKEVRKIAEITLRKLKEMDPTLATQLDPQFGAPKWDSLFKASFTGDDSIPVNKRGSGVRRLILLNFFRAKAELDACDRKGAKVIYAVEEPETSQHPHNQRLIVSALRDLTTDGQVIITTHTPMLARTLPDTCLRYIQQNGDGTRNVIAGGTEETNTRIAQSLGVLPDHNVKLFIGVEGKHDITFLQHLAAMLRNSGQNVPDLVAMEQAGEVIFFILGGSSLAYWNNRLAPLRRPEFHLYDRDAAPPEKAKYQDSMDKVNAQANSKAICTGKKEMENYLHFEAINEAYHDVCHITLGLTSNFADFDDVPAIVAEKVHVCGGGQTPWAQLDAETKKEKESKAKRILNDAAASRMTLPRLQQTDPQNEVLSWLQEIDRLSKTV